MSLEEKNEQLKAENAALKAQLLERVAQLEAQLTLNAQLLERVAQLEAQL